LGSPVEMHVCNSKDLGEILRLLEWLAQVAYGDLPAYGRQSLALDAFLQLINNLSLKQHLLVAEVEMMERALRLGNTYFQADSTCRPRATVQQVEVDDDVSTSSTKSAVHVAVAAADELTSLTTSLVRELLAKIRHVRQQSTAERPTRLPTAVIGRRTPVCWGCGGGGHFIRSCLYGRGRQLNDDGPR